MRSLAATPSRRGRGLDARAVLLSSLLLILAVKGCATSQSLAWAAGVLAIIGAALGVPWRTVLLRSLWVLPLCLAALPLIFTVPGPALAAIGPLTISAAGVAKFGVVTAQCLLCLLIVLMASSLSDPFALVEAMGRLGCPQRLVSVLRLCLRYLELLSGELDRLQRARQSRGCVEPGLAFRARITGQLVGTLFLRSLNRAERVELAMRSRGAVGGVLPDREQSRGWSPSDSAAIGLALALAGISWSL